MTSEWDASVRWIPIYNQFGNILDMQASMATTSPLIVLAKSLREALDTPLTAGTKEEKEARLEILDMLPILNRKLVGDVQAILDMAWGVNSFFPIHSVYQTENQINTI